MAQALYPHSCACYPSGTPENQIQLGEERLICEYQEWRGGRVHQNDGLRDGSNRVAAVPQVPPGLWLTVVNSFPPIDQIL